MNKAILLLILISGSLAIALTMQGIRDASVGEISGGMICGFIALVLIAAEGESHGA